MARFGGKGRRSESPLEARDGGHARSGALVVIMALSPATALRARSEAERRRTPCFIRWGRATKAKTMRAKFLAD
jgi:hypothetical protein